MKKFIIRTFSFFFSLGVLGVIALGITFGYFSTTLPPVTGLSDFNPPIPSQIISADGEILMETGSEKREMVTIEDVPQKIVDAFLAAEDANFYNHNGIDYLGILRATIANLKAGRVVQGGSTITQQVAKQLYLTRERKLARKIKDMLLARVLEEKFTKDEILFLYLNQVYLGGGYYGVKAAFKGYFNKDLEEATVAESAMIAGLLVAPGKYSPYVNPSFAKKRQNYVLTRLYENGKISKEAYEEASSEPLQLRIRRATPMKGGHFTDWVRQRVVETVGNENFLQNGFKVITTLNYELQRKAERDVMNGVREIDKRQGYKGPIGSVKESSVDNFIIDERKNFLKDNSHYFTLFPNGDVEYEQTYNEKVLDQVFAYEKLNKRRVEGEALYPDNQADFDDPMRSFLKDGEYYKAIIEHVDNIQDTVFASIAGVKGFIPQKNFQWARERIVQVEPNYVPLITNPGKILKRGDIVLVKIEAMKSSPFYHFPKYYRERIKEKSEFIKELKGQSFLRLSLEQEPDAEGALVAIDNFDGKILALVGGADFTKSQFNRAIQSLRQPGSSYKPIIYAAALENGFTPANLLLDSPESLGGVDDSLNWKPRNYDGKFKGAMTFRTALQNSRNVPTIKLASQVGVEKVIEFTQRLGLDAEIAPDLSLSLGSFGVTLLNMTSTYAIFPNGGNLIQPFSIVSVTDRFGKEYEIEEVEKDEPEELKIEENKEIAEMKKTFDEEKTDDVEEVEEINQFLEDLKDNYVYDKRLAYIMTNLLKGIIQYGTGRSARGVSSFIGGKTGTTNNYVDAWFIGFSPRISLGVWTGFDDNQTLGFGEAGSKAALPIWKDFMKFYIEKSGETDFKIPDGIVNVRIDKNTGKLANTAVDATLMESFVVGTEPGATKEISLDAEEGEVKTGIYEDDYFTSQ